MMIQLQFPIFVSLPVVVTLLLSCLVGCTPETPNADVFTTQMHLGGSTLSVLKATKQEQFFELASNMPALNDNKAIWYVFDKAGMTCLGMQYTSQDVDVAFMDTNHKIVEISHLHAHGTSGCPHQDVASILELPDHWLDQHHISIGFTLTD